MISVNEALKSVLARSHPLPPIPLEVTAAVGRVLAEDITSSVDSPPHDKSLVDGYALRASDVDQPGKQLEVLEEVTAGDLPTREVTSGTATRLMTGVAIPPGADAVVMLEETDSADGKAVSIRRAPPDPGSNIMRQGVSMRRGQTVIEAGSVIVAVSN